MVKILVGSMNPVKIEAVKDAFMKYFEEVEISSIEVDSGVADQPFGDETYVGAGNRSTNLGQYAEENGIKADFFVGIEGGLAEEYPGWMSFGVVCIKDKEGRTGIGTSAHFPLPSKVIDAVKTGKELGTVIDELTGRINTKQGSGAIGLLSRGVLTRKELYVNGVYAALVKIVNKDLFED